MAVEACQMNKIAITETSVNDIHTPSTSSTLHPSSEVQRIRQERKGLSAE